MPLDKIKNTFRPRNPPPATDLPYSFEFEEVDESFVLRELSLLKTNKATGLDQINAKLLKDSASTIASSLTKIFNASLLSQTFPDIWKNGKITPLFKSNDPTAPNNYRPITILPIISKIMERIVHRQVYKFLREHNLITSEQFGFRPNLSTKIALTRVTEEILINIDNKLITGAVFIDLRKAFDTVDDTLLIAKLKKYWIFSTCYKLVHILFIFTCSSYIDQQHYVHSKASNCRRSTGKYSRTSTVFNIH